MYFHKVLGHIPLNKHREFEQTVRSLGSNLPEGCTAIEFSNDLEDHDKYHFISFWERLDQMEKFARSAQSIMLLGAFKALGSLHENKMGLMIEIKPND